MSKNATQPITADDSENEQAPEVTKKTTKKKSEKSQKSQKAAAAPSGGAAAAAQKGPKSKPVDKTTNKSDGKQKKSSKKQKPSPPSEEPEEPEEEEEPVQELDDGEDDDDVDEGDGEPNFGELDDEGDEGDEDDEDDEDRSSSKRRRPAKKGKIKGVRKSAESIIQTSKVLRASMDRVWSKGVRAPMMLKQSKKASGGGWDGKFRTNRIIKKHAVNIAASGGVNYAIAYMKKMGVRLGVPCATEGSLTPWLPPITPAAFNMLEQFLVAFAQEGLHYAKIAREGSGTNGVSKKRISTEMMGIGFERASHNIFSNANLGLRSGGGYVGEVRVLAERERRAKKTASVAKKFEASARGEASSTSA
jgi:hypothetical protein